MYYVYILHSKSTGKLYKGKTTDLKGRLSAHNHGQVKSTKFGIPWYLVHYQAFVNSADAGSEEMFLKSGKGRERIKYLLKHTLGEK